MKGIKFWPHVVIIAIVCAVVGGAVAGLWVKRQQEQPSEAQAQVLPSAARVERVDGTVALNRSLDNNEANKQWIDVTPNTPISTGDRLYTRENSRAAIAFTGRNFARLDDNTSLDVLSLSHGRTQLALRDGSAIFNVGELAPEELFEVATPYGAIDFEEPGLYEVGIDDNGSTIVSVLSGLAQVVGLAGSGQISKGEVLTLIGQTAADVALSRIDPSYAGGLVDDYYGYQYPRTYDGRYRDYDAYLNDPYYYDPYNRYSSYQYVDDSIPGVYDLDYYGDWQDVNGYGYVWRPRVEADWAPYQQGYWTMDNTYGLTWVSNDPWGYAPYHYGRWAYINNQWFWIPDRVNTQPAYAPALVAFVPMQNNLIGWAPLGVGDPYAVTYYDANLQPVYLTQTPVIQQQLVNLYVPGAVTVVPVQDFNDVIDRRKIKKVDKEMLAQVRPVLDPLAVDSLRQAAMQNGKSRRKADVPEEVAQRLNKRNVITSTAPVAPPFKKEKDVARALRVESVSDKQRKEKLQFKDNRQVTTAAQPNRPSQSAAGQPPSQASGTGTDGERNRKAGKLEAGAAADNKEARRQIQDVGRQQQRQQRRDEQAARRSQTITQPQPGAAQGAKDRGVGRAQGERVSQPVRAERPQAAAPKAQQPQQVRQPTEKQQGGPKQNAQGPAAGKGKGKGKP